MNNTDNVKSVVWANKPDASKTGAGTDSATVTFNDGSTVTIKGSYVVNGIDTTDLNKAIKDVPKRLPSTPTAAIRQRRTWRMPLTRQSRTRRIQTFHKIKPIRIPRTSKT